MLESRGTKNGQKLWKLIKTEYIENVMTDNWKVYNEFIPIELHKQSKKETYTVEGYNSIFRYFLASFRRKTKCYSKSIEMVLYSVILLMAKSNNLLLSIFN